ncbi:MAG: hypothetical protein VYA17_02120 [Pseudomonadota bacterium]|nr:hypothetical protein [Pseudomonadota bacterium]
MDIIELVSKAADTYGVKINRNGISSGDVVILIDDFSSYFELQKIIELKKRNDLKYVLIATEFETHTKNGVSFNEFKLLARLPAITIRLLAYLYFWTPTFIRKSRLLKFFIASGALIFFIPFLFTQGRTSMSELFGHISFLKRCIYMKARRLGYERFIPSADLLIKTHPAISDKIKDVILPPLTSQAPFVDKKIKVSGTETLYRVQKCNEFSERVRNSKKDFQFLFDGNIVFDNSKTQTSYGYAYQPAQTPEWNKSNPIKIWRDYVFHGAIPIVDQKFSDHPIEDIAIIVEDFFSNKTNQEQHRIHFEKYLKVLDLNNEKIFKKIKELVESC